MIAAFLVGAAETLAKSIAHEETAARAVRDNVPAKVAALRLWYDKPAGNWEQQGMPMGNGRLGCMLLGGVEQERVQFNENLTLEITVTANTVATVRITTSKPETVSEGGRPVAEAQGVKVLRQESRGLFLVVGAGVISLR